jgi:hypothetical protein
LPVRPAPPAARPSAWVFTVSSMIGAQTGRQLPVPLRHTTTYAVLPGRVGSPRVTVPNISA